MIRGSGERRAGGSCAAAVVACLGVSCGRPYTGCGATYAIYSAGCVFVKNSVACLSCYVEPLKYIYI
jgi:hypothetical protein